MAIAGSLIYDTKLDSKDFEKGLDGLNSKTVAIGNILADAFEKVVSTITEVVKSGINYNAQLEQYQVALTTLTGSSEEAQKVMKQIKEDAAKTPFDVAGLTQANQLLISTGLSADESRETILALGDAVSATGGGNEELSRMAVNLQQVKNVGKATSVDIKQFAYAGIDIYGLLADYLGITKEEAAEMEVTWDDLNGALLNASQEGGKYFGAMSDQSGTMNGQISTLKDNFMTFAGEATEPLFNFLKDTALPVLNDLLTGGEKTQQWLKDNEQPLTLLGILIGTITTALIAYNIAINATTIATTIATVASTAFGTVMAFITSPITLVIFAIGALIAIGYLLIKNWDTIKDVASKVFDGLVKFFKDISKKIGNAFNGISSVGKNIVEGIWKGITGAKDWLLNKIKSFAKTITQGIKDFFGIKSPSKVMEQQVGKFLPAGIAVGIDKNTIAVTKAMDDMNDEMVQKMRQAVQIETGNINANASISSSVMNNQVIQVNATFEGNVEMDKQQVGRVVTPVISKTLRTAGVR